MKRRKQDDCTEGNSSVYNKIKRLNLRCAICPPNRGENAKRKAKRGAKKPRKTR